MKEELAGQLQGVLAEHGFDALRCDARSCFDVAARREYLLLAKVLENIDALSAAHALELRRISAMLAGHAFVVGERTKCEALRDGVLYERYALPGCNVATLAAIVEDEPPRLRKHRITQAHVNGQRMAELRVARGMTLEALAEATGISKDMLYRYEHGRSAASEENALLLEHALRGCITLPLDVFGDAQRIRAERTEFAALGFESIRVRSAPFEILAKERERVIASSVSDMRTIRKRAALYEQLREVLDSYACFMLAESRAESINGIPVVTREELGGLRRARELIKLIEERV
jgi:predicted transcriptional regulator